MPGGIGYFEIWNAVPVRRIEKKGPGPGVQNIIRGRHDRTPARIRHSRRQGQDRRRRKLQYTIKPTEAPPKPFATGMS